ncbi:MAG: metal ABC transporter permease [Solirubrobacterales bacterium]|nr:metal ABC transporter permease [Solirubrobacterales bacterium]
MIDWIAEPLSHGTTVRALVEIAILGVISGAVGCWVVLFEVSYSAESLAHGMFPGLVGAALLGVPLLLGGAIGIILAALLIATISRFSGDEADTAIAVVVTTLFGLGVLMALSPESPPGIQSLLFGDLLGVGDSQLAASAAIGIVVLGILWLFHDRLLAIGFQRDAGPSFGIRPGFITALLLALVALTVLVGVQGLGNLLVAAILVGPAAAARLVSRRIGPMMLTAVLIAVIAGVAGIYASYYLRTAAGASVVVALLACYLLAAAAAAIPVKSRVTAVRISS